MTKVDFKLFRLQNVLLTIKHDTDTKLTANTLKTGVAKLEHLCCAECNSVRFFFPDTGVGFVQHCVALSIGYTSVGILQHFRVFKRPHPLLTICYTLWLEKAKLAVDYVQHQMSVLCNTLCLKKATLTVAYCNITM